MNWKRFLAVFAGTYIVLFFATYIIVTVLPVFACSMMIVYAACQSGSVLNLAISLLIYTGLLTIIESPFVYKYFQMKKQLEDLIEYDSEP